MKSFKKKTPRKRKTAEELKDVVVTIAITKGDRRFVRLYSDCYGMTPSQFYRQAGIEKLVREGAMPNPMAKYAETTATVDDTKYA